MELVVAHKGKKSWRCRVRGHEAHSSLTPLRRQCRADRVRDRHLPRPTWRASSATRAATTTPTTSLTRRCTSASSAAAPPSTSCRATAMFDFEIRHLPFDDPDALFADVQAYARALSAGDARGRARRPTSSSTRCRRCPASTRTATSAIAATRPRLQRDARASARCRSAPRRALFHGATIPTIICGPGHIAQAHQPNEWVALEQLARCEAFMQRLADRICVRA